MPAYDDKSLYEALKELGVVDSKILFQKFEEARSTKTPFEEILISSDLITDAHLGEVISGIVNVPLIKLSQTPIPDDVLNLIPEIVARNYKAIVFKRDADGISIATSKPGDNTVRDYLVKKTGLGVKVFFATERDIEEALNKYTKDITKAFKQVIEENIQKLQGDQKPEIPLNAITDTILNYAYNNKASDIHIGT